MTIPPSVAFSSVMFANGPITISEYASQLRHAECLKLYEDGKNILHRFTQRSLALETSELRAAAASITGWGICDGFLLT